MFIILQEEEEVEMEKTLDPSFNNVCTISKLTFVNKTKGKIPGVYVCWKVRDRFNIVFIL